MMCNTPYHDPEYLDMASIGWYWLNVGGSVGSVVEAVATSWWESNRGDRYAISSACCIGLWQICEFHLSYLQDTTVLFDPAVNAQWAVSLSANGLNWAPWDGDYLDLERAARRYPVAHIEPGAPAEQFISPAQAALIAAGLIRPSASGATVELGPAAAAPNPPTAPSTSGGIGAPQASPVIPGTAPPFNPTPGVPEPGTPGNGWESVQQLLGSDQIAIVRHHGELRSRLANYFRRP